MGKVEVLSERVRIVIWCLFVERRDVRICEPILPPACDI